MASRFQTRTPETFGTSTAAEGDGIYAWTRTDDGDQVPTGASGLTSGQAFSYNGLAELIPNGDAITDDPYWEENGDGDLVPKSP